MDKSLNNEKNNNKNKSNKTLNKILFNNHLKSNKKKIKNRTIEKKNFPEDSSFNNMAYPKNSKVPNDSDNNITYSTNTLQLNNFFNIKKKENYKSLNNSAIINNNDNKDKSRNDIKLINVNFNNEMTISKKSKSLTPKNEENMKFLKDKLNPDTKKIKVKERRVKKCIKYLNLKEFNKLINKNNHSNKKIINQTENLNINTKNLDIDINEFPENKKGIIEYKRIRPIKDKNNKQRIRNKCFINKDLSIDSINLNIPGKNYYSPKNSINIKKNLNEKKILNNSEFEDKYRISSPTLSMPLDSDYSKYYINKLNKTSDSEQKINLNNNKKVNNILSKSQDNYKKITKMKISKPEEENCFEKNINIQEYKYIEKSSNKNICLPQ
jgi:hypothetical protein